MYTLEQLAAALKAGPLTGAQIMALDPGYICQNPALSIQALRARGFVLVVTNAAGVATYSIPA